jgi:hypothetical protein
MFSLDSGPSASLRLAAEWGVHQGLVCVGQRFFSSPFGKESHFFGKKILFLSRGCEKNVDFEPHCGLYIEKLEG